MFNEYRDRMNERKENMRDTTISQNKIIIIIVITIIKKQNK